MAPNRGQQGDPCGLCHLSSPQCTRANVCQLMRLARLHDHFKEKLLANDPSMATLTLKRAMSMAAPRSKRLRLITTKEAGVNR